MANIKRANTSGVTKSGVAIADIPDAPTIGTATALGLSASITYTAATTGGTATTFTAISTPGSITATGSSPITVSGLTDGTSYTFTVRGSNSTGTGPISASSNSITAVSPLSGGYDSLATVTLSGNLSSVVFAGIPTGYKHLQLRSLTFGSNIDENLKLQFNEDTSSSYSRHSLNSDNTSTPLSYATAPESYIGIGGVGSTTQAYLSINDILDYSNVTKFKTVKSVNGSDRNGTGYVSLMSGNWRNTSVINTITISPTVGTLAQYSSFALYGVK